MDKHSILFYHKYNPALIHYFFYKFQFKLHVVERFGNRVVACNFNCFVKSINTEHINGFTKRKNYSSIDIHFPWKTAKAIYVWSILFSQLVVSILIGVVLQLLWEDRPITEPL